MTVATSAPFASQVRLAKTRFLEERIAPRGVVADAVARSWERSQALGLRPQDKTLFSALASSAEARVIAERARRLIDAVTPEIERVAAALTHSKMVVFCTNAEGTIVHTCCHAPTTPRELRDPLGVGRSIGEDQFGTTAPGCVLAEHCALTITGEEHFLFEVSRFVCAAAPIFKFDGSLAGVVDATGLDVVMDDDTAELVHIAARGSEHRLFAATAPGLHLRLHQDPRFLDTPLRGMLAVGEDGRVLGACSTARRALKLGIGERTLEALFAIDYRTLQTRLHARGRDGITELRTVDGHRLFASVQPSSFAEVAEPVVVADGESASVLERVTSALVKRTLAEHGGNVSAAARALGISRGTLYKKAGMRCKKD